MKAAIKAIEYYLPEKILTNDDLAKIFPEWTAEKIEEKLGICERHIVNDEECSSDLALAAINKLFNTGMCKADDIDYILLCTQSPDYRLPTTACLLQNISGIPTSSGAIDFNLGCSGYVYGLGLAKGLIETDQAHNVLLVTAETYSKFINPDDKGTRTLFGDAASATLIQGIDGMEKDNIGPFVYGTDGRGANNLIVSTGGMRNNIIQDPDIINDENGNQRIINHLYMNGPEIFNFALQVVPHTINRLLEISGKDWDDVDHFVFHQANRYMLDFLRRKLKIPAEKFCLAMAHCGNTVSSSIPITLKDYVVSGKIKPGQLLMLVGFGVGYSWGSTFIRWLE